MEFSNHILFLFSQSLILLQLLGARNTATKPKPDGEKPSQRPTTSWLPAAVWPPLSICHSVTWASIVTKLLQHHRSLEHSRNRTSSKLPERGMQPLGPLSACIVWFSQPAPCISTNPETHRIGRPPSSVLSWHITTVFGKQQKPVFVFRPLNVWWRADPLLKGSQVNASKWWHHPSVPVLDVSWPSVFPIRDKEILTLQPQSYQFALNSKLSNSFQDKMNYSQRDHGFSTKD